jgi:hypothetical protein
LRLRSGRPLCLPPPVPLSSAHSLSTWSLGSCGLRPLLPTAVLQLHRMPPSRLIPFTGPFFVLRALPVLCRRAVFCSLVQDCLCSLLYVIAHSLFAPKRSVTAFPSVSHSI